MSSLVSLLISLCAAAVFSTAQAENNSQDVTNQLSQTTPSKNPQVIVTKINTLSPQVKKISFPENDDSLKNLTGYTADAIKNPSFNDAYKKMLSELPKNVHNKNLWLDKLENATTIPTVFISTPEGNLISLSACKPHDCPTNIKMLFNPQTNSLWAIVHIDNTNKSYLLGNPSDDQVALLLMNS